jgi:hypothetical protein
MEVTASFVALPQQFLPVFTAPTFQTFVEVLSGWALSPRHRHVTDVIFTGGNLDNGHWCRFHRFFSHAAWDPDVLSLHLAKLVARVLAPGATSFWAVDGTLRRKRGLHLHGAGMRYDPLISSKAKALVSRGHDWVVLRLVVAHPFWARSKVFALPIAARLYRNRQGLTKGKKGKARARADPNHRTRPELAVELISLAAAWFPQDALVVTADSARGGQSVPPSPPANVRLISHVHPKGAPHAPPTPPTGKRRGAPRKKGGRLPGMAQWAGDESLPWAELEFDQFGLHAASRVKTRQALYYKAGGPRLLTIVLTRDVEGQRPGQMFYRARLDWGARQILPT